MDFNVLPECYIDTKLVKILVPPRTNYNHQKGTNVLKKMAEQLADEFALGVVDEDVEDRQYAQQFQLLYDYQGCLRLLKHPNRPHFLIYLCPAVEKWIIGRADEAAISLTDFGLPHDFDKLRKLSKTSKSEAQDPNSDNFQRLFKVLRQANPPAVAVLTFWISHLKENSYTADLGFLQTETYRLTRENV
jgi:hypothetical protein